MDEFASLISSLGSAVLERQPELKGAGEEMRDQFIAFVPGLTAEQEQKVFTFVATYLSDISISASPTLNRLRGPQALEALATVFAAAGFVGMAVNSGESTVAD